MVELQPIQAAERKQLRQIAETYWQEIMPHADVVQDDKARDRYFQERFPLNTEDHAVQWAVVDSQRVGFAAIVLEPTRKKATIEDFYVVPGERRKGYGAAMVQALNRQLDRLAIELVELNVRRDTPNALAFWEAQGFRVAQYQMRQYRDPQNGRSFIGALSSDFA